MALTVTTEVAGRSIRVTIAGRDSAQVTVWRTMGYLPEVQARLGIQVDTPDSLVGYDYEAPLDVPLLYIVRDAGTGTALGVTAAPVTLPSHGKDWWVSISQPSLSRNVLIESLPTLTRALGHALVQPQSARSPIAVISARRLAKGTLTLLTLTYDEAQAMRHLLDVAPFFLLNGPAKRGYPNGGLYLLAADYDESRTSRWSDEPSRRWSIAIVEIDRPPLEVPVPEENTWRDWVTEGTTLAGWRDRTSLDLLNEPDIG